MKVTSADIGRGVEHHLAQVLARAFFFDPITIYAFPNDRTRSRQLERFFLMHLRHHYLPRGEVYVAEEYVGAALWLAPRSTKWAMREVLAELPFFLVSCLQCTAMIGLARLLAAHHPRVPHYYLGLLGVDPDSQRRGVGSKLLQPVLDRCDQLVLPAYLESSSEANTQFYERRGFAIVGQLAAPRGGPPIWLMWREPKKPPEV